MSKTDSTHTHTQHESRRKYAISLKHSRRFGYNTLVFFLSLLLLCSVRSFCFAAVSILPLNCINIMNIFYLCMQCAHCYMYIYVWYVCKSDEYLIHMFEGFQYIGNTFLAQAIQRIFDMDRIACKLFHNSHR